MTEVISKDEALRALGRRMGKQPMDDEYLFGVYNGLKCAKGIIEALPGAAPQTAQAAVHAADRRMEDMKRLTYMDGGKWRIRLGDTEYSGKEVDYIAAIEDILGDDYDMSKLRKLVDTDKDGRCLILPCKIGETVYVITTQSDDFCGDRRVIVQSPFRLSLLNDICKRVFLTYEEAEAVLKAGKPTDAK